MPSFRLFCVKELNILLVDVFLSRTKFEYSCGITELFNVFTFLILVIYMLYKSKKALIWENNNNYLILIVLGDGCEAYFITRYFGIWFGWLYFNHDNVSCSI